ncbi:MAG: two-component regulator propeller domain-containing protein [Terracidiphilus sp.]|nr:two-component regulator propeller domain-containing protein [Terracidiphilus sp.]
MTAVVAAAKPREIDFKGYTKRIWEANDGLAQQTIQALAQGNDGSLWVGTQSGLMRFDGARFRVYDAAAASELGSHGVNCLLTARDGSLWIGTEGGGLLRYRDGRFVSYARSGAIANEFVRAVYEDSRGMIWVGGDQGLFHVKGNRIERIDGKDGVPTLFVRSIAEDRQGRLWVGGTKLLDFEHGVFVQKVSFPRAVGPNLVTSMLLGNDGRFWVGTLTGLSWMSSKLTLQAVPGISSQVDALKQSKDNRLWVGTIGHGLYRMSGGKLEHADVADLPSRSVNALLEDQEANLWIGTHAGIVRLTRTPVSVVPLPGGADSLFESLSSDERGNVWVAGIGYLFRIHNGLVQPNTFPHLAEMGIRTVVSDLVGGLWIGTNGAGLVHRSGKRVERFVVGKNLVNNFVRTILVSRDKSVWVGTDGGVTHLIGNRAQNYSVSDGLSFFTVTSLYEDNQGGIWVGTSRGLSHLVGGQLVHDAATAALAQEQLWSIVQDSAGVLWFGTSSGLFGLRNGTLVHVARADGLASERIYVILCDRQGGVWLVGPESISRVRQSDLDGFSAGSRVVLTFYRNSVDLNSAVFYSGLQPEGVVGSDGGIWVPSNKGVIHIDTRKIAASSSFPIRIEAASAEGQPLSLGSKIVLNPGNARLELSYAVVHLGSQEGIRYRYQMEGLEDWNEVYTRRTAYYTHLPTGTYRFRVQAYEIGNPGEVSEASTVIVQRPHFYTTVWFIVCCVFLAVVLGLLVLRLRLQQMRNRVHAVYEERVRLAREMHDTLLQGCAGVSTLIEAVLGADEGRDSLRLQLLNYANEQIHSTIDAARDAVWELRNSAESAEDAGLLCRKLAREIQSDSGLSVSCYVEGVPFLLGDLSTVELLKIVREAVSNAVAHASAREIVISVHFTKQDVTIEVRDDGCGFDPDAHPKGENHFGLLGMRERTQLLHGTLAIVSKLGEGTVLRIAIPRKQSSKERALTNHGK